MSRDDADEECRKCRDVVEAPDTMVHGGPSPHSSNRQIMREATLSALPAPIDLATWADGRCNTVTKPHAANRVLTALMRIDDEDIALDVETRGLDLANMVVRTVQLGWINQLGEAYGVVLVLEDDDGRDAEMCGVVRSLLQRLASARRLWSATQFDAYAISADPMLNVRLPMRDAAALHHLVDSFGATLKNPLKTAMAKTLPLLPRSPLKGVDTLTRSTHDPMFQLYAWLDAVGLRLLFEMWREEQLMLEGWSVERLDAWLMREQALDDVARSLTRHGVLIDRARVSSLRLRYADELSRLRPKIDELSPGLNINSTPQKVAVFEGRGVELPMVRRPKTKTYSKSTSHKHLHSTDELVVAVHQASVFEDRVGRLDEFISESGSDGRVHSTFKPLGAVTTRWSSSAPNVQNIPKRGDGAEMRSAFVAGAGQVFVQADLSQIEYRMAAMLSGDAEMRRVYAAGGDLHVYAAQVLNGVADPTKAQREDAKGIGFGKLYSLSLAAAAIAAGVSEDEMRERIDRYDAVFPELKAWCLEVASETRRSGFTRPTPYGRIFKIPSAHMAVNYLCQSTAREVFCDWLLAIAKRYGEHIVLVIHDEVVLEVPEAIAEEVAEYCRRTASELVIGDGSIPIVAEARVAGREWQAAYA